MLGGALVSGVWLAPGVEVWGLPLVPEGLLWVCGAEPEGDVVSGVVV